MERPFLDLIECGQIHVKFSAAYRISPEPHALICELVARLIRSRPDRLVWGSDWPFVMFDDPAPDMGHSLDAFFEGVDDTTLNGIFVSTPERLYGFDPN